MSKRRVVVTGLGVISALGSNRVEFWDHLSEGKTGIRPLESLDASQLRNKVGLSPVGQVLQLTLNRSGSIQTMTIAIGKPELDGVKAQGRRDR